MKWFCKRLSTKQVCFTFNYCSTEDAISRAYISCTLWSAILFYYKDWLNKLRFLICLWCVTNFLNIRVSELWDGILSDGKCCLAEHGMILDEFFLSTAGKYCARVSSLPSSKFWQRIMCICVCSMKENFKLILGKDGQLKSLPEEIQD